MKILKFKKAKGNSYKILTQDGEYKLYDDIIIKHELLLKKEIDENSWQKVLKDNSELSSYYAGLKALEVRLRTAKELRSILSRKKFNDEEIEYAVKRITNEGYLNNKVYIEAYIHDKIALDIVGEQKILNDLKSLGFTEKEILPYLDTVDKNVYQDKIKKYIDKKAKANKKSVLEFKKKMVSELINKGFNKSDIESYLAVIDLKENEDVVEQLVLKLYRKYMRKYDEYTTIYKIKNYLYSKGYSAIDVEEIIKKASL